jgi:GDPmannose 4,6-dehydratase
VREFVSRAFARVGLPLAWEGAGVDEKGVAPDGRVLVEVDPRYFRPTEVEQLLGDPTRAREELGWAPEITFGALVDLMVDADLELARRELTLKDAGFPGERDDD